MTSFLTLEIKVCKVWQMGLSNILMFDFLSMSRGHYFFIVVALSGDILRLFKSGAII
jgi:hypothetical protein